MSLYDRLTNRIDDDEPEGGLSPLDIADLPPDQRKVMFSLLRDTQAATQGISIDRLNKKLGDPESLQETVDILVQNGWLIAVGEEENLRYKVNIRRKRSSSLNFGIWSSLSERITGKMSEFEETDTPARETKLPDSFTNATMADDEQEEN